MHADDSGNPYWDFLQWHSQSHKCFFVDEDDNKKSVVDENKLVFVRITMIKIIVHET